MTMETMLGAAIAIVTIAVTKLLELWQQSRDHTHQLKKAFFEKKLAAAEHAVSMWYSMSSSYSALSALYEKIPELQGKATGALLESINNSYFAQLNKLTESSSQFANAVYLYFDFESDTAKAKEPLKTVFDAVAELQDLALSLDVLKQIKKESVGDSIAQEFVEAETAKLRSKAIEHLSRIRSVFDAVQQDLHLMLKTLRTQMKQFE